MAISVMPNQSRSCHVQPGSSYRSCECAAQLRVLAADEKVASAVQLVGFDHFVGYLHSSFYGRPALALDLVEEFRPVIVDMVVLSLLNRKQLVVNDFVVEVGAFRLKSEKRSLFFTKLEERLNEVVQHPLFGYQTTYRHCIELQVRLLAKYLTGEIDAYPPFHIK